MDRWALDVQSALKTHAIGHPICYYPVVGSTMDEARRLAEQGMPEGTVVLADEQTAGRGRFQRNWWAPAGSSLLLSLVFRPPFPPRRAHQLTMVCSLAVCDAIASVTGMRAAVKWPNDVLIGGRKVCGILAELDLGDGVHGSDVFRFAVVGIGVNVNVDLRHAPCLMAPATSLAMETRHSVSRVDLLVALLAGIEERYLALCAGRSCTQEWAGRLDTLGQRVQVCDGTERLYGLAAGVEENGALLLWLADGSTRRVLAGDVTLRSHDFYPPDGFYPVLGARRSLNAGVLAVQIGWFLSACFWRSPT